MPLGDWATWITGLATIALFVVGFMQIRNEREVRKKSDKAAEMAALRSQAERISCWLVGRNMLSDNRQELQVDNREVIWVAVLNNSSEPVYRAVVALYSLDDAMEQRESSGRPRRERRVPMNHFCIAVVPPGMGYAAVAGVPAIMIREPGVAMAFTDAAGLNWIRMPLGELIDIDVPAQDYFGIRCKPWWLLQREPPERLVSY